MIKEDYEASDNLPFFTKFTNLPASFYKAVSTNNLEMLEEIVEDLDERNALVESGKLETFSIDAYGMNHPVNRLYKHNGNNLRLLEIALQVEDPNPNLVKLLLEIHADPTICNDLVTNVVRSDKLEMIGYLAQAGAHLDDFNDVDDRQTPLVLAIKDNNYKAMRVLYHYGADLLQHYQGKNMLCLAVESANNSGDLKILNFMIGHTPEFKNAINERDENKKTPLEYADTQKVKDVLCTNGAVKTEEPLKRCIAEISENTDNSIENLNPDHAHAQDNSSHKKRLTSVTNASAEKPMIQTTSTQETIR